MQGIARMSATIIFTKLYAMNVNKKTTVFNLYVFECHSIHVVLYVVKNRQVRSNVGEFLLAQSLRADIVHYMDRKYID